MDKEKKLKENGPVFTGASINPNETALAANNSKNGGTVAVTDSTLKKNTNPKDNKGETPTEGDTETIKEVAKPKPKKAAAKKEK